MDSEIGRHVLDIIEWLAGNECHDLDDAGLMAGLGKRLGAAGLPLDRLTLHLRTLHPEIVARTIAWAPAAPVEIYDREHGLDQSPDFVGSAICDAMRTREWVAARADNLHAPRWTHLDVFRNRGLAELVVAPLLNADGPVSAVGFGTCRPGGFSPPEREVLARIAPALRGVCELRILRQVETTLLDTYVGTATGRRILAGHIRRGEVETLEAALMLCDLRGFTALSNRLPSGRVLELLNVYFDHVVPAITAAGGEVLKFMGDAVLAFFRCDEGPAASCAVAFGVARAVLARLASASESGTELQAAIALHHGAVSYGNIGAGRRLDFTVIGPDVNLTSRIQTTCAQTGQPLLMSRRFADLLGRPGAVSAGRYDLKGFCESVELFAWPG